MATAPKEVLYQSIEVVQTINLFLCGCFFQQLVIYLLPCPEEPQNCRLVPQKSIGKDAAVAHEHDTEK